MNLSAFKINGLDLESKPVVTTSTLPKFRGIEVISSTEVPDPIEVLDKEFDNFLIKTKIPKSVLKVPNKTQHAIDIDNWKNEVEKTLGRILEIVEKEDLSSCALDDKIFLCIVPFLSAIIWTTERMIFLANKIFYLHFQQSNAQALGPELIHKLLKTHILPIFKPKVKEPAISFTTSTLKYDATEYKDLYWRNEDARMFVALTWLFQQEFDLAQYIDLLLSPILVVIYDLEFEFRRIGIQFVSKMITCVSKEKLISSGINVLFKESLANCLLFDSEAGNTLIADEALDALLLLLRTTETPNQESFYKFLNYDIVQTAFNRGNFKSKDGRLDNAIWFLRRSPVLISILGPYLQLHLKTFLSVIYQCLETPRFNGSVVCPTAPLLACDTFDMLYSATFGNVKNHISRILVAVLRCWSLLSSDCAQDKNIILSQRLIDIIKKLSDVDYSIVQSIIQACRNEEPSKFQILFAKLYDKHPE